MQEIELTRIKWSFKPKIAVWREHINIYGDVLRTDALFDSRRRMTWNTAINWGINAAFPGIYLMPFGALIAALALS